MPHTRIWIHLIWSTKNRDKIITSELKPRLLQHIKENSIKKEIFIDTLNCVIDHIHLLISLGTEQTIAKVTQLIKGESSHWVNNSKIINHSFEWQDDYIAVSVSESVVEKVRDYIMNQKEHHREKSFEEEYGIFMEKFGFQKFINK